MYENNENKKYKYDAFISYRHTELDKYVATKIHKYLENFKLPKSVKKKEGLKRTKIKRVFRDKEELTITNNLEDPIIQALKDSEYLIVICSPRTKESVWCSKEIEKFTEFHGRDKILTVLIEGEPSESFPAELLVEEEVVKEAGIKTIHRKNVEPLAADVRANSKLKMRKLIKSELLRLMAPMFGLDYDDLRQRHRERRVRKIVTATAIAAVFGLMLSAAGLYTTLQIKAQNEQIKAQNIKIEENNKTLLINQSKSLAEKSFDMLEIDDRENAILYALQSLTEYNGMEMPYTSAGKYALVQSLNVYDNGEALMAERQFTAESNIRYMDVNSTGEYLLVLDMLDKAYVWNVIENKLIYKSPEEVLCSEAIFIDDSRIVYTDDLKITYVYDLVEGEEVYKFEKDMAGEISLSEDGKYLAITGDGFVEVVDTDVFSSVYKSEEIVDYISSYIADGWLVCFGMAEDSLGGNYYIDLIEFNGSGSKYQVPLSYNVLDSVSYINGKLYLIVNNVSSMNSSYSGAVVAIDLQTMSILWTQEISNSVISETEFAHIDGKDKIIIMLSGRICMLDALSGAIEYDLIMNRDIANLIDAGDNVCVGLDNSGIYFAVDFEQKTYFEMGYLIECNLEVISGFMVAAKGCLIQSDNRVVLYWTSDNSDRVEYEEDIDDELEYNHQEYVEAKEEAKELGVSNYVYVKWIVYSEDEQIAFVSLENKILEIYDVKEKKLINRIENIEDTPLKYLGKDNEGNMYVTGDYLGYCIDTDYNIVAAIKDLVYVDKEANSLVVYGDDKYWEIPIYSTEELIELAEEALTKTMD